MKKLLLALLILLAASSCRQRAIGEEPSPLLQAGLYIEKKLDKLFSDNEFDHRPGGIYGMSLDETGKYTSLLKTIDSSYTALQANPRNVELRVQLGTLLYNNELFEDAIEQYTLAMETDSTYIPAYYQLVFLELNVRSSHRAIEHLQRLTSIDPQYAPAYDLWGDVLLHEGKFDEAIEKYEHALRLDSTLTGAREGIELARDWGGNGSGQLTDSS